MGYCTFKDLYLDLRLLIKFRLVTDYLQSHHLFLLVVEGLEHLSERTVAQPADDLVSVGYRISSGYFGLAGGTGVIFDGLDSSGSDVVDIISKNLLFFEGSEEGILLLFLIFPNFNGMASLSRRVLENRVH